MTIYATGTSPRMRGKRVSANKRSLDSRNIPAYAGKTHGGKTRPARPAEHPRVCGENSSLAFLMVPASGTSPRMRGKLGC